MEFILFIAVAIILALVATNFTHWVHVLRYKKCKVGKEYSSCMKNDTTKAVVTKIDKNIIWYKLNKDGEVSKQLFSDREYFFTNW